MWFVIGFISALIGVIGFTIFLKYSEGFRNALEMSVNSGTSWNRPTPESIKQKYILIVVACMVVGTLAGIITAAIVCLMAITLAIIGLVWVIWKGLRKLTAKESISGLLDKLFDL